MSPNFRREQLVLLITLSCFGSTHLSVLPPALPELAEALGVSIAAIGWAQGSAVIPGIICSALIGFLADRFGAKRVVLTCVAIFTVFGAAGFFATSFWVLLGLRMLQGVGTSGVLGLSISLIGELVEDERDRTRALGLNLAFIYIFQMVVPVASGVLAEGGVFRPFLLYSAGVPIAIWALRLEVGRPKGTASSPFRHAREARDEMRRRRTMVDTLGLIAVSILSMVVLHGIAFTAIPLLLDEVFGTNSAVRGVVISAFQVGAIVTTLAVVRMFSSRISGRVMSVGIWLMSIGLALVFVAGSPMLVAVGLAISGAGFGLVYTLAQRDAIASVSLAYRGLVFLSLVTGVRIAQMVGPPASSLVTDVIGPRSSFLIAAVVIALAAVTWRPLRRWVGRLVYS
ncbi:MAG: MFS transporter [bacterium]|nr:MFS transporter [Acidimicrobiia bacterium]MCY4621408.1 MFS transporter [bacterium]